MYVLLELAIDVEMIKVMMMTTMAEKTLDFDANNNNINYTYK